MGLATDTAVERAVSLGEIRQLHPENKGEGSSHKGGTYVSHSAAQTPEAGEKPPILSSHEEFEPEIQRLTAMFGPDFQSFLKDRAREITEEIFQDSEVQEWMADKNQAAVKTLATNHVYGMMDGWRRMSNAGPALSLQLIMREWEPTAAVDHFGEHHMELAEDNNKHLEPITRAFARVVYAATQKELEKWPGDTITLYRGIEGRGVAGNSSPEWMKKIVELQGEPTNASFKLQPLSSFSDSVMIADEFTGGPGGICIKVEVPKSKIFGLSWLGFGSPDEREVAVIGGDFKGRAVSAGDFEQYRTKLSEGTSGVDLGNLDAFSADWLKPNSHRHISMKSEKHDKVVKGIKL